MKYFLLLLFLISLGFISTEPWHPSPVEIARRTVRSTEGRHGEGEHPPRRAEIPNDTDYWRREHFAEMVLPIHLPTNRARTDLIRVWLKIPNDRQISVRWIGSQSRYSLVYPAGTVADRVESMSDQIEDVRGARIDENGNTFFHVYEIEPGHGTSMLVGYEWQREDVEADRQAGEELIRLLFPPGHGTSVHADHWRRGQIEFFRKVNQCGACHQPDAPVPATTVWPFRLESDSRGFFQPIAVLKNWATIRDHRSWDINADYPFVTVRCGSEKVEAVSQDNYRGYHCPGERAPIGTLDLQAALKKKDGHALLLCESRRYLFTHMDEKARKAFRRAFQDCGKLIIEGASVKKE